MENGAGQSGHRSPDGDVHTDLVRPTGIEHPVVAAAALALALVADDAVARAWSEASILPGYRVGGLAAHLVRAIETIRTYATADPPPAGAELVDAAGYSDVVLADHDPIGSDFHAAVRARGESRVDAGHAVLVAEGQSALDWLATADLRLDSPVQVIGGVAMALGDYLDTRLIELVVHSDDLAASVQVATPQFSAPAYEIVAGVLTSLLGRRQSSETIALGLARPERHPLPSAFEPGPPTSASLSA